MDNIKSENLILKSINQLFNHTYLIPSYQRGYRWNETQVVQLLNDIQLFSIKSGKSQGEFYCLQPIVVNCREDKFEVIDGQQRLTTIYLIVKYLEDLTKIAFPNFSFAPPKYETRSDSSIFLENIKIKTEKDAEINIDFFHIWKAYNTIKTWFENKENNYNKIDFINTLLKFQPEKKDNITLDIANNVRVIWYEVSKTDSNHSIDIFTRLNIGKIPLTNSELIKALLLQRNNFPEENYNIKQIQIATEWDSIEKALQDDSFWYFIYNKNNHFKYENRIEFIFDLMFDRKKDSEHFLTFNNFYNNFQATIKDNKPNIDSLWLDIKKFYLTLDEWYRDYELYHYIGFLIDSGISIITIKGNSSNQPKDKFKNEYLKAEIRKQVKCDIDNLEYEDKQTKRVLLLFNVLTVLQTQKSDMRFPFHKYKSENWDIEHIRSQTDKTISIDKRVSWIEDMIEFFIGDTDSYSLENIMANNLFDSELTDILNSLAELKKASKKIDDDKFNKLFTSMQKHFKEDNQAENIDSISNLALLDSATNRSYGNSFFPIKRKRIIQNDSQGIFVPIATKNVFLKYYSKKLGEVMYWNNDDAKDYLKAIKSILSPYLPKEN